MTVRELERRIDRLRPVQLVVLARLPDGTELEMTAPELVEAGAEMVRVLRGNSIDDVRLVLGTVPSVIG